VAATLYAVPASHPCAAVERALQLKGIEYRRIDVPPVAHKAIQFALFRGDTVPGLVLDSRRVLGSRAIVRALEERTPEPRLLPADDKERKSVELAEGWGDEVQQPLVRRVIWSALRRSPASVASYSEGSKLPIPAPVARLSAPLIARAEQRLNAADLQIGSGLALLLTVEDVASPFGGRPASELAERWFPGYPGRVPSGVLPAEWFRGRTSTAAG
jgi:glutathione S-transferase